MSSVLCMVAMSVSVKDSPEIRLGRGTQVSVGFPLTWIQRAQNDNPISRQSIGSIGCIGLGILLGFPDSVHPWVSRPEFHRFLLPACSSASRSMFI